jgi:hypothetical protein
MCTLVDCSVSKTVIDVDVRTGPMCGYGRVAGDRRVPARYPFALVHRGHTSQANLIR